MKAKIFRSQRLALVAGVMMFAAGVARGPSAAAQDASTDADAAATSPPASQPLPDVPDATAPAPPNAQLSSRAAEVVKLAQAGMGEDVLLAYIGAAKSPFSLGSDQIVYLNDVGISSIVIKAMIQRDAAINADAAMLAATNIPPAIPDTSAPPPPDDGSQPPPPLVDDSTSPPVADNPGDYANTDDTAYFYDSLAPYGSWIYVAGAGLCWQPTVAVVGHGWRPYSDQGRWLYTDSGWYWQSDYSWGWAAFHYGRWFRDQQRGWVWAPNRVWGPAWVSWRQSAEYCGWAPLPPAAKFVPGVGFRVGNNFVGINFEFGLQARQYTFIPLERMADSAPVRYSLLRTQSEELYQQTKVANNFTTENNRVVSRSIDPQLVARLSGVEVRQAQIHELAPATGRNVQPDRLAERDGQVLLYRPQLPKPDLNYASKVKAAGASAPVAVGPRTSLAGSAPARPQPLVLGPSPQTLAAQAEHKSFILMVPERHFDPPAAAPAYPANSLVLTGNGADDAARYNHPQTTSFLAGAPAQPAADQPPQYYYPQSHVLTVPHPDYNGASAPAHRGQTYYHSENPAPAPAYHAPILVPPAYSHAESAPAPTPAYHPAPESHSSPPPQESHSSPPPSSSSSSSSSSSGHH